MSLPGPVAVPVVFDVNVLVLAIATGESPFRSWPSPPTTSGNPSADCLDVINDAAEFALWLSPHILANTGRVLATVVKTPSEAALGTAPTISTAPAPASDRRALPVSTACLACSAPLAGAGQGRCPAPPGNSECPGMLAPAWCGRPHRPGALAG